MPILGIHAAYLASAAAGHIPSCLPYLEGCTSISAAGRHPPGSFLFRATMLPAAGLSLVFWSLSGSWLASLGDTRRTARKAVAALGTVGALFLVLYVTFLGSPGEFYNLMRRYGTTVYFSFTFLAQLLLAWRLAFLKRCGRRPVPGWIPPAMTALAAVMLALGLLTIPLRNFIENDDAWENILEWNVALLMHLQYGLMALAMWRSGARLLMTTTRQD